MELIRDEISTQILEATRTLAGHKPVDRITVRDVLKELNITNRVFYNRFRNIDEVLSLLYEETVIKVRESLNVPWHEGEDYFQHILEVASRTLIYTYESRQNLSRLIFRADSASDDNFEWWSGEIQKLIQVGKDHHYFSDDLDEDTLTYSIWCFIRGFNTDAIGRNLPVEQALMQFKKALGYLLNGVKNKETNYEH